MELVIKPRPYQQKIFNQIKGNNSLVILPTGTGKTIIAYMAIIEAFKRDPETKVLFLAPTKPLCVQHMQNFKKQVKGYDEPEVLTGEIDPQKRKEIYKKTSIIFATPQTIENDLKYKRISLEDVSLLIIDEAHRTIGSYAYVGVANYFKHQKKKGVLLSLTASPASQKSKAKEICNNLDIEVIESLSESDLKEYMPEKKIEKIEVTLPDELKEIQKALSKEIDTARTILLDEGFIKTKQLPKSALISMQRSMIMKLKTQKNPKYFRGLFLISMLIKLQHAQLIFETYGPRELLTYMKKLETDTAKSAKFLAQNENILKIKYQTERIVDSIEHPKFPILLKLIKEQMKLNKDSKIMVFVQYRNTTQQIFDYLEKVSGLNPVRFIGQAGKDGLKQSEQIEIINQFKEGKYNVLIATSISEEGIDIVSADVAILFEAVPSAIRSIQRRGRVGRINFGKVYILVAKDTIDSAYYYVAQRKESKMKQIIDDMKDDKQKRLDEIWK